MFMLSRRIDAEVAGIGCRIYLTFAFLTIHIAPCEPFVAEYIVALRCCPASSRYIVAWICHPCERTITLQRWAKALLETGFFITSWQN
jgi:phage shock protein PspC (stress-responsive transcriptional regulator)